MSGSLTRGLVHSSILSRAPSSFPMLETIRGISSMSTLFLDENIVLSSLSVSNDDDFVDGFVPQVNIGDIIVSKDLSVPHVLSFIVYLRNYSLQVFYTTLEAISYSSK